METIKSPVNSAIAIGLATLVAAIVTGFAFAGWFNHGADIFLSYTASGLAWCL
jgi:hypothetical protein